MLKLAVGILLSLMVTTSCNKKSPATAETSPVNNDASSEMYDSTWERGRKLFLENCGACHLTVKKDEIFTRFRSAGAGLSIDQNAEEIKKILAGEKHLAIPDDIFNDEELQAIARFIMTPQKTGAAE